MEEKVNMNDDSIKLLRECEAGIKMGISAIDDVIDDAQDKKLKSILTEGKDKTVKTAFPLCRKGCFCLETSCLIYGCFRI